MGHHRHSRGSLAVGGGGGSADGGEGGVPTKPVGEKKSVCKALSIHLVVRLIDSL